MVLLTFVDLHLLYVEIVRYLLRTPTLVSDVDLLVQGLEVIVHLDDAVLALILAGTYVVRNVDLEVDRVASVSFLEIHSKQKSGERCAEVVRVWMIG